jgi:hypothetical protein
MRLDDEKVEALRRWGQALREARSEQQAAAGRAILILIEENERLRLELSRTREQWDGGDSEVAEDHVGSVASTLHERLQPAISGATGSSSPDRSESVEGSGEERGKVAPSPEAWIESLRRQR